MSDCRVQRTNFHLIVKEVEDRFSQAYQNYHQSFMSVVENIDTDNIYESMPAHILDAYHRTYNDYQLALKMYRAHNLLSY